MNHEYDSRLQFDVAARGPNVEVRWYNAENFTRNTNMNSKRRRKREVGKFIFIV